jgi:hypothetical protein
MNSESNVGPNYDRLLSKLNDDTLDIQPWSVGGKQESVRVRCQMVGDSLWVHSDGMAALGRPELEVRNVPILLAEAAGDILYEVCNYIIDTNAIFKAGDTLDLDSLPEIIFVEAMPIPGEENYYKVEHLSLITLYPTCPYCALNDCDCD